MYPPSALVASRLLFSAAISATAYIFVLSGGSTSALFISLAFVVIVPLVVILLNFRYPIFDKGNLRLWLFFATVLSLNLLANNGNYDGGTSAYGFAVAHVAGLILLLLSLQWAASNLAPVHVMRLLVWMLTPLVILALLSALEQSESARVKPFERHPNWWGELLFVYTVCCLTLKRSLARWVLIGLAFFLIFLVQSRGAFLAASVSITCYITMKQFPKLMTDKGLLFLYSGIFAVVMCAMVLWQKPIVFLGQFFSESILLLDDPNRGLGTGFTGRIEGWRGALEVFSQHPFLGQGIDTLSGVHNGYLILAGEGGVVLLSIIFWFMALAVLRAWRTQNNAVMALIFGYSAYVLFAPRMLNMNIASMMFFLALFRWRNDSSVDSTNLEMTVLSVPPNGQ